MKFEEKWGSENLRLGWTGIPTALFLLQKELSITPLELNVLLHIILHWWGKDMPHPSQKSIATRIGVSTKTVQRALQSLESSGLLKRIRTSRDNKKFNGRNMYDLSGLVKRLEGLIPLAEKLYTGK